MNFVREIIDVSIMTSQYIRRMAEDSEEEEANEENTIPKECPENQKASCSQPHVEDTEDETSGIEQIKSDEADTDTRDTEDEMSSGIDSLKLDGSQDRVQQLSNEQYEIRVAQTNSALIGNKFDNCVVKIINEAKNDNESSENSDSLDPAINDERSASSEQERREGPVTFNVDMIADSQFCNEFEGCSNVVLITGGNTDSSSSSVPSSLSGNTTPETQSISVTNECVADTVDRSQFFNRYENCEGVQLKIGDSSNNLPESITSSPPASSTLTPSRTQPITTKNVFKARTITNSQFCNVIRNSSNVTHKISAKNNMRSPEVKPDSPLVSDSVKPTCEVKPIEK